MVEIDRFQLHRFGIEPLIVAENFERQSESWIGHFMFVHHRSILPSLCLDKRRQDELPHDVAVDIQDVAVLAARHIRVESVRYIAKTPRDLVFHLVICERIVFAIDA
jgi:hypothetical protein